MFCLYNPSTGETVGEAATTFHGGTDGLPFWFKVHPKQATRKEFATLDEASRYCAVFNLYWAGFVPQPITPGNRAMWHYAPVECRVCGREHATPAQAHACCRQSSPRRRAGGNVPQ